jgi:hypothetical protein
MVTVERLTALTDQWLAAEPEWVVFGTHPHQLLSINNHFSVISQ